MLNIPDWIEKLQESGRYVFTGRQLSRAVGGSAIAREAAIRRLKKKRRIICPHRGFFVIVQIEYRTAASPPASWFIDDLMDFLKLPYYVGLLSAAAIHGASHQQPQVFQVLTSLPVRQSVAGRVRIVFHRSACIGRTAVQKVKTETGAMRVSTPESTALDLVRYPEAGGYLDNISTVLAELAEKIDPAKLAKAARIAPRPVAQRLGFILDQIGRADLTDPLAHLVASGRRPTLLRPDRKSGGLKHDPRWYVIPNERISAEVPLGDKHRS